MENWRQHTTGTEPNSGGVAKEFAQNLYGSWPKSAGEALSIFCSGAIAGLALEAGVHGARALHSNQYQQFRCSHPLQGALRLKWWLPVVRAPFPVPGSYQGALGTLAAGCLWSGVFGSVYVPVRAAVEATNASEAPSDTQHYHHQRPCWSPAVAAAAGSLAASCVRVPLQVVKDRMERKQFFCSLQAFERILVLEGLSSLYIGWTRSVAKNLPFDALLFLLYDTGKSLLAAAKQPRRLAQSHPHHHHQHQPAEQAPAAAEAEPPYKFWEAAAIGGMAGAAASLLTSPLELLSPPSAISLWARNHDGGTRAGNLTGAAAVVRGIKGWDGCSAGDACQRTMHLTNKSSGGGSGVHVPPRGTSLPPLGHVARDLFPPAMGSLDGASVGAHSSPTAAAALPRSALQAIGPAATTTTPISTQSSTCTAGTDGHSVFTRSAAAAAAAAGATGGSTITCSSSSSSSSNSGNSSSEGTSSRSSSKASSTTGCHTSNNISNGTDRCTSGNDTSCTRSSLNRALSGKVDMTGRGSPACASGPFQSSTAGPLPSLRQISLLEARAQRQQALDASRPFLNGSRDTGDPNRWKSPAQGPPPGLRSPSGMCSIIATRMAWAAFEGAVFFPSLETAIPVCDWLFLPSAAPSSVVNKDGKPAAELMMQAASAEASLGHAQGLVRHPAHPLHW